MKYALILAMALTPSFASETHAQPRCDVDRCIVNEKGEFLYGLSSTTPKKYYKGDVSGSYMRHYCNHYPHLCH